MASLGGPHTLWRDDIFQLVLKYPLGGRAAGDDQLGGYTVRGYNAKKRGYWMGVFSCFDFMVVAQSWDQSGCHVAWIITPTTGMDLMPERGAAHIRSIYLVLSLNIKKGLRGKSKRCYVQGLRLTSFADLCAWLSAHSAMQ